MMERTFLFMVLVLQLMSHGSTADEMVEIKADLLEVNHEAKTARFEGHVRGTIGAIAVRCELLALTYDEVGEINTLRASGGVTVVHESNSATASVARLDAKRAVLILEGRPVLTRGPHRLEGSRIEIHLKTGRLDVLEAKGKFSLKKGAFKNRGVLKGSPK
jgi:lipopolysaccharide export system protein LptA